MNFSRAGTLAGLILIALAYQGSAASAEPAVWQPSEGHTQIPIWPGAIPDAQPPIGQEDVEGEPTYSAIHNVSQPTMTVYPPKGRNTGTAILVFPGGGYKVLAIDIEGTEICDWLTSKGITCVLVKYRVPNSGPHWERQCHCHIDAKAPMALEDAQRTLGLVRFRAAEWHVDPHKIGVIGFSAGGHVVASISTHFETRAYAAVDAADKESCRPDFAIALYPGHLALAKNSIALNPDIASHITHETPPTFLLQNEDDHVDRVEDALSYYMGLKKADVPVELHSYAQGGHAFGLRGKKFPVSGWPQLVETWLGTIGMLSA